MNTFFRTQKNVVQKIVAMLFLIIIVSLFCPPTTLLYAQVGEVPTDLPNIPTVPNPNLPSDISNVPPSNADSVGPPAAPEQASCSYFDVFCYLDKFSTSIINWFATGLLAFGGLILWLSGVLLKAVLQYTIVDMAGLIRDPAVGSLGSVIKATWITFRDLANMFFIFILLYAAIGKILDIGVNMNKVLRNVILVAIFLNFSLFFTQILVDGSNILTINFYNKIQGAAGGEGGISGAFMQKFGLTTFYDVKGASEVITKTAAGGGLKMLQVGAFGLVFMLIAAFVFFAMSVMFIKRFVTLIFLFIFSPLAFAALAVPNNSKWFDKWWKSLWNQLMFGPACLMLLWVVLQILGAVLKPLTSLTSNSGFVTAIVGKDGGADPLGGQLIMGFIIVISLLIGVLIVANQLGATGAESLIKTGKKWAGTMQGYLGRGAVRATRLNSIDQSIKDSRIGNTRVGNYLREQTTGRIVKEKFGSKESVADVDKRVKKADEKRTEFWVKREMDATEKDGKARAKAEHENKQATRLNEARETLRLQQVKTTEASKITEEGIRSRAYEIHQTPGNTATQDENWLKAEKELKDAAAAEAAKLAKEREELAKTEKDVVEKIRAGASKEQEQEAIKEVRQKRAKDVAEKANVVTTNINRAAGAALGTAIGAALAGPGGAVVGGIGGYQAGQTASEDASKTKRAVVGGLAGAAIGSVFGPIGVGVGGAIGAATGAFVTEKSKRSPKRKAIIEALEGKDNNKKKGGNKGGGKPKPIDEDADVDDILDQIKDNDDLKAAVEKNFGKKDEGK